MRRLRLTFIAALGLLGAASAQAADAFTAPWQAPTRAIVIDAYEHNAIDWQKLVTDKRIAAFIGKASDGLGEPWTCREPDVSEDVCRLKFRRYFIAQELYQTRRALAKALGLKWGSYHLARAGDPIAQADHYLEFAEPAADELMAIDIEGLQDKWMSLADAERFVLRIFEKTGRYPVLYANGSVANRIADQRDTYRVLSRLPLWYARFAPEIAGHFPKGNWDSYALWQFSATPNCNARRCAYRVPGTPLDIDVNVADMSVEALRAAWPHGGLLPEKPLPPKTEPSQLVAEAPPALKPGEELIPVPASAPRGTDTHPKVLFVAMANIMDSDAMALPLSVPENLGLLAKLYRHYGAGRTLTLVSPAIAEEAPAPVIAATGTIGAAVDLMPVGSITVTPARTAGWPVRNLKAGPF